MLNKENKKYDSEQSKQVCPKCMCVKEFRDKYWYVNNFCNTCGHALYWEELTYSNRDIIDKAEKCHIHSI